MANWHATAARVIQLDQGMGLSRGGLRSQDLFETDSGVGPQPPLTVSSGAGAGEVVKPGTSGRLIPHRSVTADARSGFRISRVPHTG